MTATTISQNNLVTTISWQQSWLQQEVKQLKGSDSRGGSSCCSEIMGDNNRHSKK